MKVFTKDQITDQKRVARAEHWILARGVLRARDSAHRKKWRLMMVAGPKPEEEINCIREVLPSAIIHAVDMDKDHVALALQAGADFSIQSDLRKFSLVASQRYGQQKMTHSDVSLGSKFDVICLDMTCHASTELQSMINIHWAGLADGGILLVTFSYGRDVREVFSHHWEKHAARYDTPKALQAIEAIEGIPRSIAERLYWLFGNRASHLCSVVKYQGNEMPMLNCALVKSRNGVSGRASFVALAQQDFEAAVMAEDLGNVYACPKDRIISLRRSAAARKAVSTRRARSSLKQRTSAKAS